MTRVIKTTPERNDLTENSKLIGAEKRLISLIIEGKKNYQKIKDEFLPEDFSTDILRRLAEKLYSAYENNDVIEPAIIINAFRDKEADFVSDIFCNLEIYENESNTIQQLVTNIKLDKINEEIEIASKENNVAKLKELFNKRLKLEGNKRCQN